MDMFEYFKLAFSNYAEYKGRATAKEFWYFVLCHVLIIVSFFTLLIIGAQNNNELMGISAGIVLGLYFLASFIPFLMLSIRRMHDTGKSGWALLLGYIPLVGPLILIILLAQKSDGNNRWGRTLDLEDLPEKELALPVIEFDDDYV